MDLLFQKISEILTFAEIERIFFLLMIMEVILSIEDTWQVLVKVSLKIFFNSRPPNRATLKGLLSLERSRNLKSPLNKKPFTHRKPEGYSLYLENIWKTFTNIFQWLTSESSPANRGIVKGFLSLKRLQKLEKSSVSWGSWNWLCP